jgi:hypothetical protein
MPKNLSKSISVQTNLLIKETSKIRNLINKKTNFINIFLTKLWEIPIYNEKVSALLKKAIFPTTTCYTKESFKRKILAK